MTTTGIEPTKDKRITGRPTKLTPERQAKIVDMISKGNYLVTACQANGITKTCYLHWLERAEREENNGGGIYYDFSLAIKKAESEAEAELASMIRETALEKREWLPGMTFLERRHPERWGRKDRSTLVVEETKQIIITTVEVVKDYGRGQVIEGEAKEITEGGKEG
ncbi:MAG: hypothetical protein KAV87_30290 [Desulfobacteraceae bacterium]|nr:hypothetical protein [Desulfobacteraceae bacterium]